MAKYLLLIYGDEKKWTDMTESEQKELGEGHLAFREAAGARVLGGHELELASTATTLRADAAGRPIPTDGPFLETKEAVGGYYLLEAADLDEAISLVGRLHEVYAGHSGVEIRPVVGPS
ncbi:MAG TPA: YciI family protein [Micromonosporaceae bacterium]|nr:YciI family protein [Micromonosporaceae bacterium]